MNENTRYLLTIRYATWDFEEVKDNKASVMAELMERLDNAELYHEFPDSWTISPIR